MDMKIIIGAVLITLSVGAIAITVVKKKINS